MDHLEHETTVKEETIIQIHFEDYHGKFSIVN